MIGMGKAVEQFGAAFFGNGAKPSGVIKFARSMKPEALKNFGESWNLIHQGSAGAHKVAILEEGMDWVSTQIPPEDAQFLATRAFQVLEVCRIFRLPPHKLADYSNSHLANVEASNEDYIATCLRPWTIRLEKAINFRLLTEPDWADGLYCKHDFRPLLLRTAKDEAEYYTKMFNLGYYTVDEMKALKGENPIGEAAGGSKRFVQVNLVDLAKAGQPATQGQEPKPDGEPGRPEGSSLRFNENHNADGTFGAGGGGAGGSGGAGGGGGGTAVSAEDKAAAQQHIDEAKSHGMDVRLGKGGPSNARESKAMAQAEAKGRHAVTVTETPKIETVKKGDSITHKFADPGVGATHGQAELHPVYAKTYPHPGKPGRWVSEQKTEEFDGAKKSYATRGRALKESKSFMAEQRTEHTESALKAGKSVAKIVRGTLGEYDMKSAAARGWAVRFKVIKGKAPTPSAGESHSLARLPARLSLNGVSV